MPTDSIKEKNNYLHSIKDLTEILIKHHDIHEGFYDLAYEVNIAVGSIPMPEGIAFPGAAVGFSRIGIKPTDAMGSHSVDAATVNPKPKKLAKPKSKA
jgi:hypothetical protein